MANTGLAGILGSTGFQRGIGNALMGLGAIGLGQDPFRVMAVQQQQQFQQDQADVGGQQQERENRRADEEFKMEQEKFKIEQQKAAQENERNAGIDKIMLAFAGTPAMFGQEVGQTMTNLQAMGGGQQQSPQPQQGLMGAPQQQQGGLAGMMANPNIDQGERDALGFAARRRDRDAFAKTLTEAIQSPTAESEDARALALAEGKEKIAAKYREPREPKAENPINMRFPDGRMQAFSSFDSGGIRKAMAAGAVEVALGAQGSNVNEIFGPTNATKTNIQENIATAQGNLAELDNATAMLETPQAKWSTGVKGWVAGKVGSTLELLNIDRIPGGPKLEDIQQVRSVLQGVIGRVAPSIRGDDSGRYTESDKQNAEVASRATDPGASTAEVKAAIRTLREIQERDYIRERVRGAGLDPASSEGLAAYANELLKRNPGMDKSKAMLRAVKESGTVNVQ